MKKKTNHKEQNLERSFIDTINFWKPFLKCARDEIKETFGGDAFSIDNVIIKMDAYINSNKATSLNQNRIPLTTKMKSIDNGFRYEPSEICRAYQIIRTSIQRIIGFDPFGKNVSLEIKKELSDFYYKEKDNYLTNKCPIELYNSIRFFVTHDNVKCCREMLVQMVARDLLDHYGDFLLNYQEYGTRD